MIVWYIASFPFWAFGFFFAIVGTLAVGRIVCGRPPLPPTMTSDEVIFYSMVSWLASGIALYIAARMVS